jgi:HEPN domain-containing protein
MKRATREWVDKAEDDYRAAEVLARSSARLYDQSCFHCQQCAEKYLKALVEELGNPIRRTHDLLELANKLEPDHPSLKSLRRGLKFLTNFSVEIRYPGDDASKRQAEAALRWASRVRDECLALLGI